MANSAHWRAWLAGAFAAGIAPENFWRLSAREWRALSAPPPRARLDRAAFEALAAQFPDQKK